MSWEEENNKLVKTFELKSFSEIIDRLDEVAKIANKMEHHPDFEVFGYKNIKFSLSTHDSNSITDKDHQLSKKIDRVLE